MNTSQKLYRSFRLGFFALGLVALFAACSGKPQQWVTFTSHAGNFSVRVPGGMQESVNITDTPLGPIKAHVYVLQHSAYRYSITYTDYPAPHIAQANPIGAVEGEVKQTLASFGAAISSKQDILLGNALGIGFRGESPPTRDSGIPDVIIGRVYLNDTRLYQLTVVAPADQNQTTDPQKFLDSFRWLTMPDNAFSTENMR